MGRWHYPKWRRTLMQVVICIIFLASVGLAEWIVRDRANNGTTRLEKTEFVGPIGIRRPEGWKLTREKIDPVLYVAQEPSSLSKKGRELSIQVLKSRPDTLPEDFLSNSGELVIDQPTVPIQIASFEGVLASKRDHTDTIMMPAAGPMEDVLIAGCVTPSGRGILIMLKCPDESPEEFEPDVQLIRDIARKIQVQAEPPRH